MTNPLDDIRQRVDDAAFGMVLAAQMRVFSVDGLRLAPAVASAVAKFGVGPAIGFEAAANVFGDAVGLYDDFGVPTFREVPNNPTCSRSWSASAAWTPATRSACLARTTVA